ncbi:asparaginase [Amycolatopsis minnesotensis]|uniref:Asparaginase n=1 Tax=Amycolatopsis minnesotensis TaxID=337894 RepID=A0ABN2SGJ1_9PSEU
MTPAPAHEPLVHILREGMTESVHHGSVVVLRPDGSVLFEAGDPGSACYPRSAAKPVQATAMARLGLDLDPDLMALAAASHSGEEVHLDGVRRILSGAGLGEAGLRTPEDYPFDPVERDAWVAAGRKPSRIGHNCSGKHSAMLAVSRAHGWPLGDYLDPEHPLQQEIRRTVEALSGETVAKVATDGCGAPLFSVSLRGLTAAIGRVASGDGPERLVAQGIRKHPEMLAGSRRDVTWLMRAVPGLIAKDGFEAVQVAAMPDGTAIGIKIADGSDRARLPVLLGALALSGVDVPPHADANVRLVGELGQDTTR